MASSNTKKYVILIFGLFLISIFVIGPVTRAVVGLQESEQEEPDPMKYRSRETEKGFPSWDLPKKIAVIYDPLNLTLMETAYSVYNSINLLYHSVDFVPVWNFDHLLTLVGEDKYAIKCYFIKGTIAGIELNEEVFDWETFATYLQSERMTQHVFGAGSTDQLLRAVDTSRPNIHIEGSAVIDAQLSFVYNLWEVGEIFSTDEKPIYHEVASDFRDLGVLYFTENMNDLMNAQIEPRFPLGEEDPTKRLADYEAKLNSYRQAYQILPDGSKKYFNETGPVPRTGLYIYNPEEQETITVASDEYFFMSEIEQYSSKALGLVSTTAPFSIADFPLFSGLEGPTAKIIDTILDILITIGGSAIGVDPGVIYGIIDMIMEIVDLFSPTEEAPSGSAIKSTLKSLVTKIMKIAPIPEPLKPFGPVVVDAIFLGIGGGKVPDITDFIKSTVSAIFQSTSSLFNSSTMKTIFKVLETVLVSGVDLTVRLIEDKNIADAAGESWKPMTTVMSFLFENLLDFVTVEWVGSLLGKASNSTILKEAGQIMKLGLPLIKFLVTGDIDELLSGLPDVAEYLIDKLDPNQTIGLNRKVLGGIETGARFFYSIMMFFDNFNDNGGSMTTFTSTAVASLASVVESLIAAMLRTNLQDPNNSPSVQSSLNSFVSALMGYFRDASKDLVNDADDFKSAIESLLEEHLGDISDDVEDFFLEMLVVLGSIAVPSLPLPKASDFRELAKNMLEEVTKSLSFGSSFSNNTKKVIFMAIDFIFGILAMAGKNTAAQYLFIDDLSEIRPDLVGNDGLSEAEHNQKIALANTKQKILTNLIKDQANGLLEIFVFDYINESTQQYIPILVDMVVTFGSTIIAGDGDAIKGMIQSVLMQAAGVLMSKTLGLDAITSIKVVKLLFNTIVSSTSLAGVLDVEEGEATAEDIIGLANKGLDKLNVSKTSFLRTLASGGIEFLFGFKDIFTDGLNAIFTKLKALLINQLAQFLEGLEKRLVTYLDKTPILNIGGSMPFKGADALGLSFNYNFTLKLNLDIKNKDFVTWVFDLIFKGADDLNLDVGGFFKKLLTFIEFRPVFSAKLELSAATSGKGGMLKTVMEMVPVSIEVSGKVWFAIQLAQFQGGAFKSEGTMKILEWGFAFTFTLSVDIPLLELIINAFAPGAGSAIGKLAKFIGLDLLILTLYFRFGMEIFYKAAQGGKAAQSQLSLSFTIGMSLKLGFDLVIVGITVTFGLEITITFTQDLLNLARPLVIMLDLVFYVKVELTFLFISWDGRFDFRPPPFPLDISPVKGEGDYNDNAMGQDADGDGLGDLLEQQSPVLDYLKYDTDGDGLWDKVELRESKTDPSITDTDGDGISDFAEYRIHFTNPLEPDTDYDRLNDWEEVFKYQTNPFSDDTDRDLLSDYYEIHHALNMTSIDPSVKFVIIGGEIFTDRTDPNDPDTDDDGLLDGEEDIFGPYYGDIINYYSDDESNADSTTEDTNGDGVLDPTDANETNLINTGANSSTGLVSGNITEDGIPQCLADNTCNVDPILIFNKGYTHPLDNDTDDDSYWQYYDGTAYYDGEGNKRYWGDLSDGAETNGIVATIIEYDAVRGVNVFVTKTFFTNPTNPDSDGDSAVCRDGLYHTNGTTQRTNGLPWGLDERCTRVWGLPDGIHPNNYMNGDGRELFEVFTNPLNADSDGDSLVDGLEGTSIFPRSFTTNPFKPDTDGDSLPDGLEFVIGTLPDNPDTDGDLVLDGDEFYVYHTNPLIPDTDFDGVSDGWELFFSHSNPHSRDSDQDGIDDYSELFIYASDPMDEDSDNDDLTDREEIFSSETDPSNPDTDGDGLRDGEEINIYFTDPFNVDSDGDSILYLNEFGEPTFLWNDGMEVEYGTDPTTMDTDFDGITDSWELYIATGNIPNFENIQVDPLNNDTDGDGFLDGEEMIIDKSRSLIYPYVAFDTIFPYRCSPTKADTDGDGLDDLYEYNFGIHPNNTDTDNDSLSDWDEIFIHLTDPSQEDTDGDGIIDSNETTQAIETTTQNLLELRMKLVTSTKVASLSDYDPTYQTSATEPDSDGDGWPDGLEINATDGDPRYDPYDSDVNRNGVPDGYERDYDFDGISDGDEYYRYQGTGDLDGGFLSYKNPDSDFDGLIDGEEILIYGTKPFDADSDLDGVSDSLELFFGTDPLVFTPEHIFLDIMNRKTTPLVMVSPEHEGSYQTSPRVEMLNLTSLDEAYFRYREITDENRLELPNPDEWSDRNYTLGYGKGLFGLETGTWSSGEVNFADNKEYEIEVFGVATNYTYPTSPDRGLPGTLLSSRIRFTVNNTDPFGLTPAFYRNVAIGVVAILALAAVGVIFYRRRVGAF
ncbi:MAG: hypothetical protein ACXAC7_04940 [Candidatus Hodarchaeales archaeon]|jgi:hypothetical protein